MGTIAFFDFDGTLLRHDSGVVCALPCARRGILGPRIFAELVGTWLLSKVGLRQRRDAMKVGFRCYGGRSLEELRGLLRDLYEHHMKPDLSPAALDRVRAHKAAGDKLVILTASAYFVAEPIAADLGFDRVIGTQVGFEGGLCTGRVEGEIVEGPVKLTHARAVADELGVALEGCAFYGDHLTDLPLLEAVGRPVAVGPERKLARVARERGYPILSHEGKLAP